MTAYPALENFLAAYFHQDWQVEHDDADAVVTYFLGSEDDATIAGVRDDLARLSAQGLDEDALGERLRALGCEYDPTREGGTWQVWLQVLATRFG